MYRKFFSAIFLFTAILPSWSQTVPDAVTGGLPQLRAGGGVSYFNPDYGHGRLYGVTLWIDYALYRLPKDIKGVGLEFEARDVSFDRPTTTPVFRIDSAGVGPTYSWRRTSRISPYAKLIFGLGNADYYVSGNRRFNQSRTLTTMGGGFEVRAMRQVSVRLDYEYQYFPDFFISNHGAPLDPQGFTLGAIYHFGREHHED
jgi:opacity protein-like surface antigen